MPSLSPCLDDKADGGFCSAVACKSYVFSLLLVLDFKFLHVSILGRKRRLSVEAPAQGCAWPLDVGTVICWRSVCILKLSDVQQSRYMLAKRVLVGIEWRRHSRLATLSPSLRRPGL